MLLSEKSVGFKGKITEISHLPHPLKNKLLSLGVLPNTSIEIVRVAPLGDPLQVRVRGCDFALSKYIAAFIKVE